MPDIMKFILDEGATKSDPDGHLLDAEEWSESVAMQIAAAEGIELTPDHWSVIHFIRLQYRRYGIARSARALMDTIDARFGTEGGRRFLYRLFPKGPIHQGCTIAGVPVPAMCHDQSFGTTQ